MSTFARTLASQIVVVAAGLAAYHFLVGSDARTPTAPPAPAGTAAAGGEAPAKPAEGPGLTARTLADDLKALSGEVRAVSDTLARLEARLGAVEDRLRESPTRPIAPAPAEGTPAPSATTSGIPATPTEEDVARFDALMKRVEKVRARERDEATWRRRLKNAGIRLPLDGEDEFVAAAAEHQEKVRDLFPGGSAGSTAEERQATLAKLEQMRVALVDRLKSRFPDIKAEEVEKMFPAAPQAPLQRPPADPNAPMGK